MGKIVGKIYKKKATKPAQGEDKKKEPEQK